MGMFSYEGSSKMLKKFFGILLHLGHCVLDFNESLNCKRYPGIGSLP